MAHSLEAKGRIQTTGAPQIGTGVTGQCPGLDGAPNMAKTTTFTSPSDSHGSFGGPVSLSVERCGGIVSGAQQHLQIRSSGMDEGDRHDGGERE
jgi:hypothetical protein